MKIAIVKLSALGDIVHSMLVLQFIKKKYTDIEIDWIVDKSFEGVLDFNPDIDKVHFINLKKAKFNKSLHLIFQELKRIRGFGPYDLVIDLQGLVKSAFVSRLIASDLTIGFDKSSLREGFASMFYDKVFKYGYEKNIIERNLALAAFALDFNFSNKEIDLKNHFLFSSKKYFFEDISLEKKNIIFVLGASYKTKC